MYSKLADKADRPSKYSGMTGTYMPGMQGQTMGGSGGSRAGMQSIPVINADAIKSMSRPESMQAIKPQLGFKLNIQSNITMNIDGRQAWNAIKPYAREDMLNYEGASGSISRNVSVTV
jgi:hypothetical protein